MSSWPSRKLPERQVRGGQILTLVGIWLVMVLGTGAAISDSDTPWHVAHGLKILERGVFYGPLHADPFSWTAYGKSWQPNGWLFDLFSGLVWEFGGWAGLSITRALLLGLLVILIYKLAATTRWAQIGTVGLIVVLVLPGTALRPGLLSLLTLGLVLVVAPRALRSNWYAAGLVLLTILWVNVHAVGVLSTLVVGAFTLVDALTLGRWKRDVLLTTCVAAGTLINPYGWGIYQYAISTREVSQFITEWQPPSITNPVDVITLGLGVVLIILNLRHHDQRANILVALGMLILSFDAVRHESLLVVALAPLLANTLTRRPVAPPHLLIGVCLVAGALAVGVSLTPASYDIRQPNPDYFPTKSAEALPPCRLLNEYTSGGYVVLTRPDVPVSQDGRNDLYGADLITRQNDAVNGDLQALEEFDPTCIIIKPDRDLVKVLEKSDEWGRSAADTSSQLWIKH